MGLFEKLRNSISFKRSSRTESDKDNMKSGAAVDALDATIVPQRKSSDIDTEGIIGQSTSEYASTSKLLEGRGEPTNYTYMPTSQLRDKFFTAITDPTPHIPIQIPELPSDFENIMKEHNSDYAKSSDLLKKNGTNVTKDKISADYGHLPAIPPDQAQDTPPPIPADLQDQDVQVPPIPAYPPDQAIDKAPPIPADLQDQDVQVPPIPAYPPDQAIDKAPPIPAELQEPDIKAPPIPAYPPDQAQGKPPPIPADPQEPDVKPPPIPAYPKAEMQTILEGSTGIKEGLKGASVASEASKDGKGSQPTPKNQEAGQSQGQGRS